MKQCIKGFDLARKGSDQTAVFVKNARGEIKVLATGNDALEVLKQAREQLRKDIASWELAGDLDLTRFA